MAKPSAGQGNRPSVSSEDGHAVMDQSICPTRFCRNALCTVRPYHARMVAGTEAGLCPSLGREKFIGLTRLSAVWPLLLRQTICMRSMQLPPRSRCRAPEDRATTNTLTGAAYGVMAQVLCVAASRRLCGQPEATRSRDRCKAGVQRDLTVGTSPVVAKSRVPGTYERSA
jgi:hypothetical protein